MTESFLLEYMRQCRSGEIVVGQELLQMFDILTANLEDPEIRFEPEDGHKRIKFIENKCKHYEAPFSGKPFQLMLFQKAFIETIYSFKIYDEEVGRWVRLYQDVLYVVGRKNGKTPLIGAINLAEFFCGPEGVKLLCSSNDYEQADLMFQAINAMREESPSLERVTRVNIKGIYFGNRKRPTHTGKFSFRNKGSIRKISAKTGAKEGRNIGVGSVDEAHEMKDNTSVMPIRQALSTQDEPLYFELTTEGFTNDGYLDSRMVEARQVLNGELERPRWLIWLYTQDSEKEVWQDENSWTKSNPGLGTIKKRSFLRRMIEEARSNQEMRAFVLAKDFNVKQNNAAAWLTEEDMRSEDVFDLEEFRGAFAIGGVDLARTGDLASARAMFMRGGKKYTYQRYFIPAAKIPTLSKEERTKYEEWVANDLVTVSEGNENDFRHVTAWFVKLYKDYGIRFFKIGYDKWSAVYWVKEMEEHGFDMVRISQDWGSLSEPMKLVRTDLQSKLINYNQHPIDRMCLENTAVEMNGKMEIRPVKIQGKEDKKIDGTLTLIFVYRVYIDNRTEFLQLVA
ncbi:Phage terminase-like protein, large subunit, contains N-terminal HTH domain [Cohnella sp. OV330]|uniref:terminase large subunit n=1 Tax=Cohnella sp. OV330 TaxID=1855288 RepID=UPI0008F06A56|nr:terminase TerL endonuclease subunit [Cohnella sp. OV330]SFB62641.1 Phage terminase-like protein, large subunit, contains N-terminal HTH domain [Cohnella sp. OV330]